MKKLLSFCLAGILMTGVAFATGDPDMQTVTSKRYVINELDKLQDKIPGTSGTKAVTLTGTRGGIEPTEVKESLGSSNSDPALPDVGAVNTGLSTKQNEIPAVNTNTVVTYTGTAGQIGQKGIYQDTGTYAAQSDNLIDAGTFNEALRTGLNNEFVCADTMPGTETCWLWTIQNETENKSPNLFDISKITKYPEWAGNIVHNDDGSLTVTGGSSSNGVLVQQTLSELAPGLEVGKTYVLSIKGATNLIYLATTNDAWINGKTKTITRQMLDNRIYLYAPAVNTSGIIYNIQIEEGTTPTPYQPYNANVYIPQGQ